MVRDQLVDLFSGAADDGQTLSQGRFESHGSTHSLTGPKQKVTQTINPGTASKTQGYFLVSP